MTEQPGPELAGAGPVPAGEMPQRPHAAQACADHRLAGRDMPRWFVLARHAESAANTAHVLSSDPARPVPLTEHGQTEARILGAQLANLPIDLAIGTRLLRTQQTIDIALDGRPIPVLIEPGFDEVQAGGLDGAPIEVDWSWEDQHTADDRLPGGESVTDALRRYANALRRLLARTETVTLVVTHELAVRHIVAAAAAGSPSLPGTDIANAAPYLFGQDAARRAADSLDALALSGQPRPGPERRGKD